MIDGVGVGEVQICSSQFGKSKKGGAKSFGGRGLASLIDKLLLHTANIDIHFLRQEVGT